MTPKHVADEFKIGIDDASKMLGSYTRDAIISRWQPWAALISGFVVAAFALYFGFIFWACVAALAGVTFWSLTARYLAWSKVRREFTGA